MGQGKLALLEATFNVHHVRPSRISKSLKPKLKTWMLDDGDSWDLEVRAQLLFFEDSLLKEKSINKLLICPIFRKCLVTFSDSPRADLARPDADDHDCGRIARTHAQCVRVL